MAAAPLLTLTYRLPGPLRYVSPAFPSSENPVVLGVCPSQIPEYAELPGYSASVTSVAGRQGLGATETTLTADTDYEVRDLDSGWIWLWSPGSYDRIRVSWSKEDYHSSSKVPEAWRRMIYSIITVRS
jgi:hypothetical protein